jgi:hypothetical protein
MSTPSIESSTREERLDYVLNEWRCLHNCELCGKCHILKGRSEEILYADYIDGKRSYMDITLEYFFASAFQNMALTAQLTVVQTSPFIQNVIQTFLSCR